MSERISAPWRSVAGITLVALGCGNAPDAKAPAVSPVAASSVTPASSVAAPSTDALGPRPVLAAAKDFVPPAPAELVTDKGLRVWLLERHGLPVVSLAVAVPVGSAADPVDRPGLAAVTADMLNEGAGSRGALALSAALEAIGAEVVTGATVDGSYASVTTLRPSLARATELLADVVQRPRFEAREWNRVLGLWKNELQSRGSDPAEVLPIVANAVLFGRESPYGHPVDGTLASARRTSLADVVRFHREHWLAKSAVFVVAGDVTRADAASLVDGAFGSWLDAGAKATQAAVPGAPKASLDPSFDETAPMPRVVLVDRADAPQALVTWTRPAWRADDGRIGALEVVNGALGGAFGSRLNLRLREEKGWTYRAFSRVVALREVGYVEATAAVVLEHAGEAIKAMIDEVRGTAREGLREDEISAAKAQGRSRDVRSFETVDAIALTLLRTAASGLPAQHRTLQSAARERVQKAEVDAVAKAGFGGAGVVVVVGPKAALLPQLAAVGLKTVDMRDEEGRPLRR